MSAELEFTVLGCGSSGGVPRADGAWGACDPLEPKNRRSRCSLLVRRAAGASEGRTTLLVDTAPDLRLQTAAAEVRRVDAVLYSHDHADQAHGIDDLRAFAQIMRRRIPCYMDEPTASTLARRFRYIFENEGSYPAICDRIALPPHGTPFRVEGPSGAVPVVSFEMDHGGAVSVGYRFADVAYCSDVVRLPDEAFQAMAGLDVLIVDALRYTPHPTHAHVDLALAWIERLQPRRAILTNLHIDLDYAALSSRLPDNVSVAFDGMRFITEIAS